MTGIALVGPDGAGKSTVARRVVEALPGRAAYLYLGTNPDVDAPRLPTTRLGSRLRPGGGGPGPSAPRPAGIRRSARTWVRMLTWLAEELYRGVHARRLQRRTPVVIRDRDFLADRLAVGGSLPRHERFHRAVLARLYPAPDATVVLDAPAELLFARKGELDLAELDLRRRGYRDLGSVLPRVTVVDATAPVDEVVERVVALVLDELAADRAPAGSGR